ncbi:hypothetical protein SDC9_84629 [bioreactor metagenome]|uniref:Uncharacterized protein n=1 Tax=bioreactor metagenome TaxID=1076179 RepID=A0A644ZAT9_9ZZZZ
MGRTEGRPVDVVGGVHHDHPPATAGDPRLDHERPPQGRSGRFRRHELGGQKRPGRGDPRQVQGIHGELLVLAEPGTTGSGDDHRDRGEQLGRHRDLGQLIGHGRDHEVRLQRCREGDESRHHGRIVGPGDDDRTGDMRGVHRLDVRADDHIVSVVAPGVITVEAGELLGEGAARRTTDSGDQDRLHTGLLSADRWRR